MNLQKFFFTWCVLVFALTVLTPVEVFAGLFKGKSRKVYITWDDTQNAEDRYIIKVNGKKKPVAFKLKKKDSVLISIIARPSDYNDISIKYEIQNPKREEEFVDAISKMLGIKDAAEADENLEEEIKVLKKLIPGGTLSITFTMIQKNDQGEELNKKVREVEIEIEDKPQFFTSTGFVFSNENTRELAIIKTANLVNYEKDGETKEGYQQKIVFKNDNERVKAKDSAVQFLHYRFIGPLYFTLGTPLNEKIFVEPFLGLSALLRMRNGGLVINLGFHLHKEIMIMGDSGYEGGQTLAPSNEITLADITTETDSKWRFFFGISFRLK